MKIAILGSGILGKLLAFNLSNYDKDIKISIFEKNSIDEKNCSAVAGGMLSPFCELASAEKIISDLGVDSLLIWEDIIKKIEHKIFFQKNGTLVIAHRNDFPELEMFRKNIDAKLNNNLLYKIINNQDELIELEPDLEKKFYSGLFFENEGQIDNREILNGLSFELQKNSNVEFFYENKVDIKSENIISDKNNNSLIFDIIFDCRGLGDYNLKNLRGLKGEIITFESSEIKLNRPIRLIHPRFPLYIIPRANNKFLIGATSLETNNHSNVTIRSALELLSAVFSINSQFGEARILELNSSFRPTFQDHLPKILFSKSKSLFKVNGLYRHGFMITPKIVDLLLNFVFHNKIELQYKELFLEFSDLEFI